MSADDSPKTSGVDDDVATDLQPEALVFRLSWASVTNTVVSAPLLRDHFLSTPLPLTNVEIQIPLLTHAVYVTLLTRTSCSHAVTSTKVYVLPPVPPALAQSSLQPLSNETFHDPALPSLIALSLNPHPLLQSLSLPPPQTFLVHAPRGAGLTSTLAALSYQLNATFIHLPATYLLRHLTTRKSLHKILDYYLEAARVSAPALIVIDDAPFLFPPYDNTHAASFLHFVRSLTEDSSYSRIAVVVCAAPDIHQVHPQIAEACNQVSQLAINPSGEWALQLAAYKSGAPLETVRSRIAASAVTTISDTIRRAGESTDDWVPVKQETRDIVERWEAISRNLGGLSNALAVLRRMLLYPKTKSDALRHFNVTPARGLLLYGPPGTGKTHLVREAAAATNYPVIPVDAAGLARGEVGESERLLTQVFERAGSVAPCIVFFDEIDALFASSGLGRLVAVLALRMDIVTRVTVIGATNKPWMVSKALLRPGRFENIVKIPLPAPTERSEIAKVYAVKMGLDAEAETHLLQMANEAHGFSGADIAGACRRAAMSALCRNADIGLEDISKAFAAVQPSVFSQVAQQIDDW